MKKLLLAFVFAVVLSCSCLNAQSVEPKNETHTVYCELVGTQKLNGKVKVEVDYGQLRRWGNNTMVDDNGQTIEFNSMVDAMNYMGELGWRFVQAYVVGTGGNLVYRWLLQKDLSPEEAINDGIKIKKEGH
ncbi:MAG: hypothetical protein J5686_04260 [Bacteroidales bacterium]|nr:hypothetical protein [Bacteroidales bacterium]